MTRKEQSEAILQAHHIKINPLLPNIGEATVKSPEILLKRALTALLTAQIAIDVAEGRDVTGSALFFRSILRRFGLEQELTPDEAKFFALAEPTAPAVSESDAVQITWRIEMCMPLFWACGLIPGELNYPDTVADCTDLIRRINACKDFDALMQTVSMRPDDEILDHADLIYRMDWACVDALLKQEPATGGLSYDIVAERHRGFNWMISAYDAENWDDVKAHT